MATARFDMRLDEKVKAKAEKASALLGMKSLTEYVVRLMDDNATQVISEYESMAVASRPNQALADAAKLTKELGIR